MLHTQSVISPEFMRKEFIAYSLGDQWSSNHSYTKYEQEVSVYGQKDIQWLMEQEQILASSEGQLIFGSDANWMKVFVTAQIDMLFRMQSSRIH